VKCSRLIQPVLKGDLDGKVETFPAFPGLEKHLLKSLIVRITYGSVICPKGVYRTNEENGKKLKYVNNIKQMKLSLKKSLKCLKCLNWQIWKTGCI
jgi:hypothetical protein